MNEPGAMQEKRSIRGITGSTIKMIAIIAMLIDHTAATILERVIVEQNLNIMLDVAPVEPIAVIYWIMRLIGRLGFPIFIFLLVEGLSHTGNQWKYLLRMLIFAFVSEIPFDLAFNLSKEEICSGQILEFGYQNVFFTLTIGLAALIGIRAVENIELENTLKVLIYYIGITIAGMELAILLKTDYGAIGVMAIVIMYMLRERKLLAVAMTCVILMFSSVLEVSAFLILLPVGAYNGKRGWKLKWVFYAFYPVHLLVLWLICLAMGIA